MIVKVEACLGNKYRLTIPYLNRRWPKQSSREFVVSDRWTRKEATEALDLLEHVYKIPRKSVRFRVT